MQKFHFLLFSLFAFFLRNFNYFSHHILIKYIQLIQIKIVQINCSSSIKLLLNFLLFSKFHYFFLILRTRHRIKTGIPRIHRVVSLVSVTLRRLVSIQMP